MREILEESPTSLFKVGGSKIHFISLGCPRNLVDTEVMLGLILHAGYEVTEEIKEASYIVINTCGFLKASRDESLSTIQYALKVRKKGAKVIVTGCMAQTFSQDILLQFPDVNYLLGSGDVPAILKALESPQNGSEITSARSYLEAGEVPRTLSTPQHYAYLKIAEGCKKKCAYCLIPKIKGPLRSKPIDQIVKEFRVLRERGVKEIILIAQDLGDWGKDMGYLRSAGLVVVLETLLKEPGDFWLRLLYLYPDEITDPLIDLMKSDPRICPYLDMPIQHINSEMLKKMHRKTSKEEIIHTLSKLRQEIPNIAIRTSLIVGFPGETPSQFQELCEFVKHHPIDHLGIFTYSQEPDTVAGSLPDQIPEKTKKMRQKALFEIQQTVLEERHSLMIGKTLKIILDGYHPESNLLMFGRHAGQCPEIDGGVIINDSRNVSAFGQWYDVEITDVAGYDLIGTVLSPAITL